MDITARLAGVTNPRAVQIVATGLVPQVPLEITGRWAGQSWPVRGGNLTPTASQVVLVDVTGPLTQPVTYRCRQGSDSADSAPITVPYPGRAVICSLDGTTVIPLSPTIDGWARWRDTGDEREQSIRVTMHEIAGRSTPIARYDLAIEDTAQLAVWTTGQATGDLHEMVRRSEPILLRTDGQMLDLPICQCYQITKAPRSLVTGNTPTTAVREWTLSVSSIEDPNPNLALAASTWDDFDRVYAESTWDEFDAEWSGRDWNELDREDWSAR